MAIDGIQEDQPKKTEQPVGGPEQDVITTKFEQLLKDSDNALKEIDSDDDLADRTLNEIFNGDTNKLPGYFVKLVNLSKSVNFASKLIKKIGTDSDGLKVVASDIGNIDTGNIDENSKIVNYVSASLVNSEDPNVIGAVVKNLPAIEKKMINNEDYKGLVNNLLEKSGLNSEGANDEVQKFKESVAMSIADKMNYNKVGGETIGLVIKNVIDDGKTLEAIADKIKDLDSEINRHFADDFAGKIFKYGCEAAALKLSDDKEFLKALSPENKKQFEKFVSIENSYTTSGDYWGVVPKTEAPGEETTGDVAGDGNDGGGKSLER